MNKSFTLAASIAFFIVPVIAAAKPIDMDMQGFSFEVKHGLTLQIAQAQAPGRPITTQTTPAPQTPVKDKVAPTAPPPPGTPNFPQRPANEPPLKNPNK